MTHHASSRPLQPTLQIETPSGPYPLYLGQDLLASAGALLEDICNCRRLLVVSDRNVAPLYLDTVTDSLRARGYRVTTHIIEPGEASKSHDVLLELYDTCARDGITRHDGLVALGGGVVGDLTGFAAATWLRGVRYIQMPTSLLAQVDASVGGKTGIDLRYGKNLVGAFKQPAAVIADVATLRTLPRRELSAGMAEVMKYALIRDPAMWCKLLEAETALPDEDIIRRSIEIKAEIVAEDEYDMGLRQILNFGHTYGHAAEQAQQYGEWRHGEAVGFGMLVALHISEQVLGTAPGIRRDLRKWLRTWKLPTETSLTPEQINQALGADKKSVGDAIDMILIRKVGESVIRRMPLPELHRLTPDVLPRVLDPGIGTSPTQGNVRVVTPGHLKGSVRPPWSKSQVHRLLIAAFLTGETQWEDLVWPELTEDQEARLSDDIRVTRRALHALQKGANGEERVTIDCRESGTSLRLLLSVTAALGIPAMLQGTRRLGERPLAALADQLRTHGMQVDEPAADRGRHLPLYLDGQQTAGAYELPGHVSSQYISGLLFALPLLDGDSVITLTTPLASAPYVDLTLDVLKRFGIRCDVGEDEAGRTIYRIPGGQSYRRPDTVQAPEADYSQAAFWLVANFLGSDLAVEGLDPSSRQGDREVVDILRRFEARRAASENGEDTVVDATMIPDIVPVLSLAAAVTPGTVTFTGASRLRGKESDRLEATLMILRAIGAEAAYGTEDTLVIPDVLERFETRREARYSSLNDHRIAMTLAIAAAHSTDGLTITEADAVSKSYPDFFETLDRLQAYEEVPS